MTSLIATIAVSLGVVLAIVAVVWRYKTRRAGFQAVGVAARAANPADRISALALVDARGVGAHLDLLVERASAERDPDVLVALARLIARSQWEPIDDRRMMELRVWARHVLETMQDVATPLTSHRMPGTGADGQTSLPGQPGSLGGPTQPSIRAGIWAPDPTPLQGGASMPQREIVLVTSAGSAAGVAAIRALIERGHRVVAVDSDREAVGLPLAHESAVVPPAGDPELAARLCKVAVRTGASVILAADLASLVALTF